MTITIEDLAKAFKEHSADVAEGLKKLTEREALTAERLNGIEQKAASMSGGVMVQQTKTLGQQLIEQDGMKAFAETGGRNDRFAFEAKATLTTSTTDAAGSLGAGIQPFRDPTITPLPRRRPVVRDLLPVIQMTGGSVEIVKVKGRTASAAVVAEAAAKPQSDMQLEKETVTARVIAHWMKASRQVLSDLPQLQGLIDTELLDGLTLAEEVQLLTGDGTGENLEGLIPNATAYSAPFTPADDNGMIDQLALACLQTALAEYPPTGIIMHPADWWRIALTKDANGNYILGEPSATTPQRLWGLPVITTQAMTVDKFLVGDFGRASTLYDRWAARVETGYVNDDFTKNLVTVLAEERLAHAIKAPLALTYGDFGNVA